MAFPSLPPGSQWKKRVWWLLILVLFLAAMSIRHQSFSWGILGLVVLCFSCELMDSSLGMGYGTTLTPVLLAFGFHPLDLVPTILVSEFLSGFAASYFHHDSGNVDFRRGSKDLRVGLMLALGSVIGVAVGVNLALEIPTKLLKLVIGCIILLAGVFIWIQLEHTFKFTRWKMFLLATVASFNKALSGGGYGPIMTSGQILGGIRGKASVAITSFAEAFTCLIGVILFLVRSRSIQLDLLVPVLAGALLSVPFSVEIVKQVRERRLKELIAALTVLMGAFTILKVFV